jgi:transposase
VDCARCKRVRTEQVPWARPRARHTKDFEDVVAFLAQRVDKTTIARLLRVSWEAVANIVTRVVADHIDEARLDDLYRIGVDEVFYLKGCFLTVVADHDRNGAVVWAREGRNADTLRAFYDELGEQRRAALEAVSLDLGSAYAQATHDKVPHVTQCVDPFHVVKLANKTIDEARRWAWNQARRTDPPPRKRRGRRPKGWSPSPNKPRWVKHTAGRCSKIRTLSTRTSSTFSIGCAASGQCSTAAGSSRRACATSTGLPTRKTRRCISTGG